MTLSGTASYAVTAANAAGYAATTLVLSVIPGPPQGLNYWPNPVEGTLGIPIGTIYPDYVSWNPSAVSWTIDRPLPAGLAFNDGAISGTPQALAPLSSYTVTASSAAGYTTAALFVSVTAAPPAVFQYQTNKEMLVVGNGVYDVPSITATTFSIDPALPTGLTIDMGTGIISGVVTAVSPATNYTVTASSNGSTGTAQVSIEVDSG
jgi:hypothetical protein